MKTLPILLAIASALAVRPAAAGPVALDDNKDKLISPTQPPAKNGGAYFAIFGGVNFAQSSDSKDVNVSDARPLASGGPAQIAAFRAAPGNDIPSNATLIPNGANVHSPTFSTDVRNNVGWLGGLKLGYVFPSPCIIKPALEFEAFYNGIDASGDAKSNKSIAGLRTSDRDGDEPSEPFTNPDATVGKTKASASFNDSMNSTVFMTNAIINVDLGRFRPYIGAGVGLAYVTHDYSTPVPPSGTSAAKGAASACCKLQAGAVQLLPKNHSAQQIEDSPAGYLYFDGDNEVTFAYQALAGVDFFITPRMSVFTEYKALFYYDGPYYRNLLSQEVAVGLRFGF